MPSLNRQPFELALVKVGVDPLLGKEFLMGTFFDNGALVDHEHLVGIANGTEPVGDNKACSSLHERQQDLLDAEFGAGIDAAGCFIKNQDIGICQNHAGNGQQLTLPLAQVACPL